MLPTYRTFWAILAATTAISVPTNLQANTAVQEVSASYVTGNIGTVRPLRDWVTTKVGTVSPQFCMAKNQFEQGVSLALAKNTRGDLSLGFEFSDPRFNTNMPVVPIKLEQDGAIIAQAEAVVKTPYTAVLQLGQGYAVMDALSREGFLRITMPELDMRVSLFTINSTLQKLQNCTASFDIEIEDVREVEALPPIRPDLTPDEQFAMREVEKLERDQQRGSSSPLLPPPAPRAERFSELDNATAGRDFDGEVAQLSRELSHLVRTQAGGEGSVKLAANAKATEDRILELQKKLAQVMSERDAARAQASFAADEVKKLNAKARENTEKLIAESDRKMQADIKALSSKTDHIGGQPVTVIQSELMTRQKDLERQARAQAQEAEWLERQRLAIAGADAGAGEHVANADPRVLAELERLRIENETLRKAQDKIESASTLLESLRTNELMQTEQLRQQMDIQEKRINALRAELEIKNQALKAARAQLGDELDTIIVDSTTVTQFDDAPRPVSPEPIKRAEKAIDKMPSRTAGRETSAPTRLNDDVGTSLAEKPVDVAPVLTPMPLQDSEHAEKRIPLPDNTPAQLEASRDSRRIEKAPQIVWMDTEGAEELAEEVAPLDIKPKAQEQRVARSGYTADGRRITPHTYKEQRLQERIQRLKRRNDPATVFAERQRQREYLSKSSVTRAQSLVDRLMHENQPQAGGHDAGEDLPLELAPPTTIVSRPDPSVRDTKSPYAPSQKALNDLSPEAGGAVMGEVTSKQSEEDRERRRRHDALSKLHPVAARPGDWLIQTQINNVKFVSTDLDIILRGADMPFTSFTGGMAVKNGVYKRRWISSVLEGVFVFKPLEASHVEMLRQNVTEFCDMDQARLQALYEVGQSVSVASIPCAKEQRHLEVTVFDYQNGVAMIAHETFTSLAGQAHDINQGIAKTILGGDAVAFDNVPATVPENVPEMIDTTPQAWTISHDVPVTQDGAAGQDNENGQTSEDEKDASLDI